MGPPFFILSF
jgi:hypothetical protein